MIFLLQKIQMTKDEIIKKLSQNDVIQKCKNSGIEHLRLFGSFAMWDETEDSDIDLLYKYNSNMKKISRWIRNIYPYFENLFGKKIDLVSIDAVDSLIYEDINKSKKFIF